MAQACAEMRSLFLPIICLALAGTLVQTPTSPRLRLSLDATGRKALNPVAQTEWREKVKGSLSRAKAELKSIDLEALKDNKSHPNDRAASLYYTKSAISDAIKGAQSCIEDIDRLRVHPYSLVTYGDLEHGLSRLGSMIGNLVQTFEYRDSGVATELCTRLEFSSIDLELYSEVMAKKCSALEHWYERQVPEPRW